MDRYVAEFMPIPARLIREGVRDMIRVSDARMSGTAYGTVVLHTSPEAAAGGMLAKLRDGDILRLDARRSDIAPECLDMLLEYRVLRTLHRRGRGI